jgi:putative ABC transport system substrate-binding protein
MRVRRRDLISLVGGAAVAWPLAAPAQQADGMRRVGVLMNQTADDPEGQARLAAFVKELQVLGWTNGRNVRIDSRWQWSTADRTRRDAEEFVALAPNVILTTGATAGLLQRATRTIPIVFVLMVDPVGSGLVQSLAHPGKNVTGFSQYEFSLSAKWLELLKEIAPGVMRAAIIVDPDQAQGPGQFGAIQTAAPSFGVECSPIHAHDAGEIERAITEFARGPNGGLIVTPSASTVGHRNLIVALAAQFRLPAVYPLRFFVTRGGLISYGPNSVDQFRRAAGYVDRILRGEKPADLPVQAPVKYETVLNLKTAKALGLDVPPTVLVRADEVIE